jgi:adenylate cyclase
MSIVSLKIRSAMVVPLIVGDEILGLLQLDTPDRGQAFTKADLELALAVSHQAAIALNNAKLLKKVSNEATTRNNLMRFLPGPVVQQVLDGQLDIAVGGRTCTGSILFSDIIGFTSLSETMDPAELIKMMNAYFRRVVPCIQRNAGSVDKFMGDAIMAVWGVPIDKGDSAQHACQAALQMQNALAGFNSVQTREGGPQLAQGIGVNTGAVTAGNIGYEQRIEYTVLGDTVNTAQRLEATAGRSQILISTGTWDALGGHAFGVSLPPVRVKNKAEPLPTFTLRGLRLDEEILVHIPCTSGGKRVHIIRRLSDSSFVVLSDLDIDLLAAPLVTDAPEWPGVELGVPTIESVLPTQDIDGELQRVQIRLEDVTLAGLLGEKPLACALAWEQMLRSSSIDS